MYVGKIEKVLVRDDEYLASLASQDDASHKERQILMILGKLDELVHIGPDGIYPTLHCRDAVALSLQTHALTHDGSKLAVGDIGSTTTVHTAEVTAKYKDLVGLELRDMLLCHALLFHNYFFLFITSGSTAE